MQFEIGIGIRRMGYRRTEEGGRGGVGGKGSV